MLSLVEVKCPHCGAQGQIMLPPLGAIIIGPCPECHNMVAIFSGRTLPLDNEIMTKGSVEARRRHLLLVLGSFLEDRINRLITPEDVGGEPPAGPISDQAAPVEAELADAKQADAEARLESPESPMEPKTPKIDPFGNSSSALISRSEMDAFVNVELQLIDDKDYFKAVFD